MPEPLDVDEGFDPSNVVIEPLDRSHERGAFACSRPRIDNFFRNNARSDHENYKVRVFVAVNPGQKKVLGFYSLTLTALLPEVVSGEAEKKFSRVKAVPAIYLAMIGVIEPLHGRGLGSRLMYDALSRALVISEHAGAYAITLDAATDRLVETYKGYGFDLFKVGERRMYLALSELRKATQAAGA